MKRVAIFVPAGIADVSSTMVIPALVNLISRISLQFDVTVYSLLNEYDATKIDRCGNTRVKFINARYNTFILKRLFLFVKTFHRDHRREAFDIVHGFWAFPCGLIAVLLGTWHSIPSIVSMQGGESASLPEIQYGNMRSWYLRVLTIRILKSAHRITALTQFQIDQIKKYGLKRNDIIIIPHGADRAYFSFAKMKSLNQQINFLHVGSFNRVKDQRTLIDAFKIIAEKIDARLHIIGIGQLECTLKKCICDLGIQDRVEFIGLTSYRTLYRHYAWAHFFLLSSLYESQAVVVAEAMMCGTVVCGTNVGLIHDLDDDTVVKVDVCDSNNLAAKILALIRDESRYHSIRKHAYDWALQHDADWTSEQFISLYNDLPA